jgi:diaminopimelate epimerase
MTMLSLRKHHGTGNDFLVLLDLEGAHPLGADVVRALCDRHRGIGADGVIRATRPGPRAGGALLCFELRNADGSEAEMSGNGMRCLAHAAFEAGLVPAGEVFTVATPAGSRAVSLRPTQSPGKIWASVEMGTAAVVEDAADSTAGADRLRVDVGNPHLVILVPDAAMVAVRELGPALERSAPKGINIEWVTPGLGPHEATMRVWERGAGETLACGTGSVAAAVALAHWGHLGDRLGAKATIHQPGGSVEVHLRSDGSVCLAGASQRVGVVQVQTEDLRA